MRLSVKNVSHSYKNFKALQEVNLDLAPGIYGLIGPNGAGKSTLMRILVDLLVPTKGQVMFNGKEINVLGSKYREILGYLPQEFNGYEQFTAEEFLNYVANLKGLLKKDIPHKVQELLVLVGLEEARKKKLKGFSGGMKRRIGIAQALLNNPEILILDEPTAGLDPNERIRFRGILSTLAQNKIILLSTHIVSDIEYIAKNVIFLKRGKIIQHTSPKRLLTELEGQVWKCTISENELAAYQASYVISNIQHTQSGIDIRCLSQEKPHAQAINVQPSLEDSYVYYFGTTY